MEKDNISDLLTRIRNASLARHAVTYARYTKTNLAILSIFFKNGYIENFKLQGKKNSKSLIQIILRYKGWWVKKPIFSIIKRISKPGRRIYTSYENFEKKVDDLKNGYGIAVISTSNGILSHLKAKKIKKGGEVLCYIG